MSGVGLDAESFLPNGSPDICESIKQDGAGDDEAVSRRMHIKSAHLHSDPGCAKWIISSVLNAGVMPLPLQQHPQV